MSSVDINFNSLFASQPDDYHTARIPAVKAPNSGDWLNALPITSCGLCIEDYAIRVAIGLRLDASLCEPINAHVVTWLTREAVMACLVKGVLGKL